MDNVLLDDEDVCKICDFGVSRELSPEEIINEQCGTPAYLAPEIVNDKGYSGYKADVWSMGVLLFVLVTGIMPFKACTVEELNKAILKGKFEFPKNQSLSDELKDLLGKMLEVDVKRRIDSTKILSHKWFSLKLSDKKEKSFLNRNLKRDKELLETAKNYEESQMAYLVEPKNRWNQFVIKRLEITGFSKKNILRSLDKRLQNHISACYYTLERDYL